VPEAVPSLITLSQATGNSSLQTYALKLLANLSESCKLNSFCVTLGTIPHHPSASLLHPPSPTAANQKQLVSPSVIVPLLKVLVTSRNMSLISYILFFFRNLTKSGTPMSTCKRSLLTLLYSAEGKEGVQAAAGMQVFVHLLKTYTSPQVLGPVLVILTHLASQGTSPWLNVIPCSCA
jgi:hypothetical protein